MNEQTDLFASIPVVDEASSSQIQDKVNDNDETLPVSASLPPVMDGAPFETFDEQLRDLISRGFTYDLSPLEMAFLAGVVLWPDTDLQLSNCADNHVEEAHLFEVYARVDGIFVAHGDPTLMDYKVQTRDQRANHAVGRLVLMGLLRRITLSETNLTLYSLSPVAHDLVDLAYNYRLDEEATKQSLSLSYREVRTELVALRERSDSINDPNEFTIHVGNRLRSLVSGALEQINRQQTMLLGSMDHNGRQLQEKVTQTRNIDMSVFTALFEMMHITAQQIQDLCDVMNETSGEIEASLNALTEKAGELGLDTQQQQLLMIQDNFSVHASWARQETIELIQFYRRLMAYLRSQLSISQRQLFLDCLELAIERFADQPWGLPIVERMPQVYLEDPTLAPPPAISEAPATDENPELLEEDRLDVIKHEAKTVANHLADNHPDLNMAEVIPHIRRQMTDTFAPQTLSTFEHFLIIYLMKRSQAHLQPEAPSWQPISELEEAEVITLHMNQNKEQGNDG